MAQQMKAGQIIRGTISGVSDRYGNPTEIEGPWEWTNTDPESAFEVTVSGDLNENIECRSTGPLGTLAIQAQADADLGEGVQPIILADSLIVSPANATVATITWENPEDPPPLAQPVSA